MKKNERFFTKFMTSIAVFGSLILICDFANAASRASARPAPTSRKTVTTTAQTTTADTVTETTSDSKDSNVDTEPEIIFENEEPKEIVPAELIIENKSAQFENIISDIMDSATPDNSFAEQIRRQRNALAASEASSATKTSQQKSLSTNTSSCDTALRKCMSETCGKDFTKCALDGATDFGDKLNKCRKNSNCTAEEFSLFGAEIKSDRDMNVRLASYNAVIDCGNNYNACIVNECGTTYNKCLGQKNANAAVQKCSVIAKECSEADSGLAARFGNAIGKLRENAEKDIKSDESRLYALRDLMSNQCKSLGATFDERSFDCVYSIEFYAGENQSTPTASRKAYAGDSFVCMQEWFGVNATTYRENAYRETRAQTAASSAMLGSGIGTAAGLISSGAINRAIDTQKAQKALKEECEAQQGKAWKNNQCVDDNTENEEEN